MRLFQRKDFRLIIAPEAFTIKAFRDIDKRDRTKDKSASEKEFAFIYFVYDPRSDLQFIDGELERIEKVKELIGLDDKFKIDDKLKRAIDVYKSLTETSSSLLLADIKLGVSKIRTYLKDATVDDDTFDKYTKALKDLIPLSQKVAEAEKVVIREVEEISNARGDKAMTILDGGFDDIMK